MQGHSEAVPHLPASDDSPLVWTQWTTLRPTQGAIGYVQVLAKKESFLKLDSDQRRAFVHEQPVKAVRGPSGCLHVIDHHHWARAWLDMGMPEAPVLITEDFSDQASDQFLNMMSERGWLHPFNEHGHRIPLSDLPKSIGELPDDVFQSLAAFVRTAGVYENPGEFNAKFAWADFFRQGVALRPSTVDGFALMLADAFAWSRRPEAMTLPGFISNRDSYDHDKTIQD